MTPPDNAGSASAQPPEQRPAEVGASDRMLELQRAIAEREHELAWANERLIAELHERSAAQASALAAERYDPASGLPNRRLFEEQLDRAAQEHQTTGEPAAVLVVGIEQLVALRASMGFRAADQAARITGERLRLAVRGGDLVGRVGDGEFAVALTHLRASGDALPVARKLIGLIDAPLRVDGHEVCVQAAMGVAVLPADGTDAQTLMQRAFSALRFARESSNRFYQFFDPVIAQREARRLQLQSDMRKALETDQFLVHYQPRVSIPQRRIVAVEALLRWLHPRFGMLPAGQFIDLAEESGLIVPIGEMVLARASAAAVDWPDDIHLSVNLSGRQIRASDLDAVTQKILAASGLAPQRLQIEVTESSLGRQPAEVESSIARLKGLRDAGIRVALDQFGTGACSLTLLRDCPVDVLNIEGGFVRSLADDPASMAILRAVASLGRHFGAQIVAEGIESEQQFELAGSAGCTQAQGYLFGRPMGLAELNSLLASGTNT